MTKECVTVVFGGEFGSEGKGKFLDYLRNEFNAAVRSGGPQAGHTFYHNGQKHINHHVPCTVFNPDCRLYLAAASIVNLDVITDEIVRYGLLPDRLMIDRQAMVVTEEHIEMERDSDLRERIASTLQGVGAAQAEKIWRIGYVFRHYAYEDPELYWYCGDTVRAVNRHIELGHPVVLEGTQGTELSLDFGGYPYVTSRNVTAAAIYGEAGIPLSAYDQAIMIIRTYPIRVGGNSGPAGSPELAWEDIRRRAQSKAPIREHTTVTGRERRVFEQSREQLHRAIEINDPDQIALSFLDYITANDKGKQSYSALSDKSKKYIRDLEEDLEVPITLVGTGPEEHDIIDRRDISQIRNPLEFDMSEFEGIFPKNFYNGLWEDVEYVQSFIERKMTDKNGEPWKTKIFA